MKRNKEVIAVLSIVSRWLIYTLVEKPSELVYFNAAVAIGVDSSNHAIELVFRVVTAHFRHHLVQLVHWDIAAVIAVEVGERLSNLLVCVLSVELRAHYSNKLAKAYLTVAFNRMNFLIFTTVNILFFID